MNHLNSNCPIEISCREVKDLIDANDNFLLLDCRTEDEYATTHIETAELIPMDQIPGRLSEIFPDQNRRVVVHCHLGGRSLQVTQWMRERGFSRVQNMTGGIDAWAIEVDSTIQRY